MPEFIFPQPTGQYAVGTKLFELTDTTHNDPETSKPRELVVQVWYPAEGKLGMAKAPYAYEAREWYKKAFAQLGVGAEKLRLLDGISTHAIPDAPACNQNAPYPLVIFGHGYGAPRGAYSFFCEEIASHGYVVTMVMHTYITFMTRFADGRRVTSIRSTRDRSVFEECFADIEYMLNQAISGAFGPLTTLCNFNTIGMVGHSLGGSMTAQTCRRDKRVKAGITLDGALWGINATKPFHKPFMFMLTPNFYEDMGSFLENIKDLLQAVGITKDNFIGSNERFCRENGKETIQIVVEGANHKTFLDESILQDLFAKIFAPSSDMSKLEATYNLPLPPMIDAIRGCILTFLNRHLKGQTTAYPSSVQHDATQEDFVFYIPDKHPQHTKIEIDPTLLNAYAGKYKLGNVIITITKGDNKLWLQIAGQPKYAIYPESETTFFYTVADRQISFVKDEKDKVTKLILHQGGVNQDAEKIE